MKPVRALKYLRPVHRSGFELADGRSSAIVNDVGRSLAGARFDEVHADAIAAANDEIGPHAFGAERAHGSLADIVRRQSRDVIALESEQGEADCHVRFSASEGCAQYRRLKKPFVSGRAETQHDFAERDNSWHLSAFLSLSPGPTAAT